MANKENNFFWLLGGLLITLLIAPIVADNFGKWLALAYSATLLVGIFSLRSSKYVYRIGWLLVVVMVITSILETLDPNLSVQVGNHVVFLLFGTMAMSYVLRAVLMDPQVTPNHIAGAISVYFLIGLNFALLYSLIHALDPTAFKGIEYVAVADNAALLDLIYYSFVTLTTLGYGDITPQSNVAQAFAYLEAATGVLYLAVMIAALVGAYAAAAVKNK